MSRVSKAILAVSLAFNVFALIAGGLLLGHAGVRGTAEAAGLVEPRRPAYDFYAAERWEGLPGWDGTVLIGDSQVERGPWAELLGEPVAVRGQSGALTAEVVGWADDIPTGARRVIVWTGSNDVLQGHPAERVGQDVEGLLRTVRAQAPHAIITVLTIPPLAGQDRVGAANDAIRQAAAHVGASLVDPTDALSEPGAFVHDGVHLTADGYEAVARALGSSHAQ